MLLIILHYIALYYKQRLIVFTKQRSFFIIVPIRPCEVTQLYCLSSYTLYQHNYYNFYTIIYFYCKKHLFIIKYKDI